MKNLFLIVVAFPFATIILCFLLSAVVLCSPIILIGYIWSTRQRNERRQSENYPLKEMIEKYKIAKKVRM